MYLRDSTEKLKIARHWTLYSRHFLEWRRDGYSAWTRSGINSGENFPILLVLAKERANCISPHETYRIE